MAKNLPACPHPCAVREHSQFVAMPANARTRSPMEARGRGAQGAMPSSIQRLKSAIRSSGQGSSQGILLSSRRA